MAELFLVEHVYGMGSMYWWIRAESAEQIQQTLAEVLVYPDAADQAARLGLEELDLYADDKALAALRAERAEQRGKPGFGALAGRERVFVRHPPDDEVEQEYLYEFDAQGHRVRQIEIQPDGTRTRTTPQDWPFNPPYDLYDPLYADKEITEAEFERAWADQV